MADPGESLNRYILPYAGQQLLEGSKETFFGLKLGLSDSYIYDLKLSTGEVLYGCKGGMGITKEPHIFHLHDLVRMPYAEDLILEEFKTSFQKAWNPRKFYRLRREVNSELKDPSRRTIAKLYCLLACSGFRYKFDKYGNFKGEYFPHPLSVENIRVNNKKLISSDFIIQLGKFGSLDENLLTKKSIVYLNVPFPSPQHLKREYLEYIDYISSKGFKFLLSARLLSRGLVDKKILSWSKNYYSEVVSQFKEDSLYASSDIFILNF